MRIYQNGRQINGRYTSVKTLFKRLWYWTKVGTVSLTLLATAFGAGAFFFSTSTVTATAPEVINAMPDKIAALKSEVVNAISSCEVPNYKAGDAPIILDTNNKMSIGAMQFQVLTVQHYEKLFYNKDLTPLEATTIALDETQAKALAEKIMFSSDDAWQNWFNCSNKTQIAEKIKVIRELEK